MSQPRSLQGFLHSHAPISDLFHPGINPPLPPVPPNQKGSAGIWGKPEGWGGLRIANVYLVGREFQKSPLDCGCTPVWNHAFPYGSKEKGSIRKKSKFHASACFFHAPACFFHMPVFSDTGLSSTFSLFLRERKEGRRKKSKKRAIHGMEEKSHVLIAVVKKSHVEESGFFASMCGWVKKISSMISILYDFFACQKGLSTRFCGNAPTPLNLCCLEACHGC